MLIILQAVDVLVGVKSTESLTRVCDSGYLRWPHDSAGRFTREAMVVVQQLTHWEGNITSLVLLLMIFSSKYRTENKIIYSLEVKSTSVSP